jgi:hypothetical protein
MRGGRSPAKRLDHGSAHDAREAIKRRVRAPSSKTASMPAMEMMAAKMRRIGVRRQDDDAARDAFQLDQCKRAGELAFGGEQHRTSGKLAQVTAKLVPRARSVKRNAVPRS